MTYEKALRLHICTIAAYEEYSSELKLDETISVEELFELSKRRYKRRKIFFDNILPKIKEKIKCVKSLNIMPSGGIVICFEEDYSGIEIYGRTDYYNEICYSISVAEKKIELAIFIEDFEIIKNIKKEKEVYFEKGILERIYKGGNSWITKILSEIKDELAVIWGYLIENESSTNIFINTISNSFEIDILPDYFAITDMCSVVMQRYKNSRNFAINYPLDQENLEERFKYNTIISTSEGDFVIINASRRLKKVLKHKMATAKGEKELLIEFIKKLRVFKSDLPEIILK